MSDGLCQLGVAIMLEALRAITGWASVSNCHKVPCPDLYCYCRPRTICALHGLLLPKGPEESIQLDWDSAKNRRETILAYPALQVAADFVLEHGRLCTEGLQKLYVR